MRAYGWKPDLRSVLLASLVLSCSDGGPLPLSPWVPSDSTKPGLPSISILPTELEAGVTARLSVRWETPYFIFHMEPGDSVEGPRMAAFHVWATGYLGITLPKKIDYYKFRTSEDLAAAFGKKVGGVAFPEDQALATWHTWHNHEAFHVYLHLFRECKQTTRFFDEGMVVAHEFDPLNHDWVARQTRSEPHSTHLETVLELRAQGELLPLESLMESGAFNEAATTTPYPVAYPEAGMFVAYLVQRFGLGKRREIMMALEYDATLPTIREQFQSVFGVSIQEAEADWLAALDEQFL